MQVMKFAAPVGCRNETFSTFRLGKKWRTIIQRGCREVELQDTDGNSIGTAKILDVWFGPLSHAPAIFLEHAHDPICRTWSGLQAVLQGIYDKPVTEKDEVTIVRLAYTGSVIQTATAADLPPESFGGRG